MCFQAFTLMDGYIDDGQMDGEGMVQVSLAVTVWDL